LPARPAGETTPPSESAEPDPDPELSAFRSAHRLHFEGRAPEAAIDAYERYIAQYPRGRYVPEARYNVGINLLRLGRTQAAREALEPFAVGRYGGYRQQEARSLIDAL
jgi:TolA-binding protein